MHVPIVFSFTPFDISQKRLAVYGVSALVESNLYWAACCTVFCLDPLNAPDPPRCSFALLESLRTQIAHCDGCSVENSYVGWDLSLEFSNNEGSGTTAYVLFLTIIVY